LKDKLKKIIAEANGKGLELSTQTLQEQVNSIGVLLNNLRRSPFSPQQVSQLLEAHKRVKALIDELGKRVKDL
jgi:hypothetical protein